MSSSLIKAQRQPWPWLTPARIALLLFLIVAVWALADSRSQIAGLSMSDTDDALRLVQVRDLLAGQAWWDISQHRINPLNGGGLMHWSRLVDAPLAGAIILLTPLFGVDTAERITTALWPLLLLAMLFLTTSQILSRLGDRLFVTVGLATLATSGAILFQFNPLRIDHHGWQIVLSAVMLMAALRPHDRRTALLCGFCAAALLAISLEGLPLTIVFAGIYALPWLRNTAPTSVISPLSTYLMALAGGATILQIVTRGPSAVVGLWCDALSAPYLAALATAAVLTLITETALRSRGGWQLRLSLLAAAAATAGGIVLAVAPICGGGPFATLDPLVMRFWYSGIDEGAPFWRVNPMMASSMLAPVLVGLIGTAIAWHRSTGESRRRWQTIGIAALGAAILGALLLRSGSTAQLFALPGCAWLALAGWRRARAIPWLLPRLVASIAPVLVFPLATGMATIGLLLITGAISPETLAHARGKATAPEIAWDNGQTLGAVADMRPALILAPLDLGPHLLQHSGHFVLATGHHRNNAAMSATIGAFTAPVAQAEAMVRSTGARLVVIRPDAADIRGYAAADQHSLAAILLDGDAPPWLRPVAIDQRSPLRAWQIVPLPQ